MDLKGLKVPELIKKGFLLWIHTPELFYSVPGQGVIQAKILIGIFSYSLNRIR